MRTETSRFSKEVIVRGRPEQIVRKYEAMAKGETDHMMRQLFLNYAEHWRKS